jgi:hypothetical protein
MESESDSHSHYSTEDLMEEKKFIKQKQWKQKAMPDCCTEIHTNQNQPDPTKCFYYSTYGFGCFKKLCDCTVANPFILPIEIIKEVPLLLFHPIVLCYEVFG